MRPRRARATARFTVTDDLPTPPLPEAMASTRVVAGIAVSGASSRAFQRARAMTAARSVASMVAMRISTDSTQSSASTWPRTSRSIWERSGQAAMVRATSTTTWSPATAMARTMPRSTMVSPSSGSITARRLWRTSSSRPSPSAGSAGHPPRDSWTAFYLRAGEFRSLSAPRCRAPTAIGTIASGAMWTDGAGTPVTWGILRGTVPAGRPAPIVARDKEAPVTTMTTSVNIGKKPAPVTLSDLAITKVAELLAQEEGEALALRVAVKPGGCSGYSYEMFFDSEVMADDVVREFGTVKVVVDSASAELLVGSTLDYSDGLQGAGFHIVNPNATRTCGCGSSFS